MKNLRAGNIAINSLLKIESLLSSVFNKIMHMLNLERQMVYGNIYFDVYDTSDIYNILIYYSRSIDRYNRKTYLKTVVNSNFRYLL